jgi:peroxiredoxin Q/BCP
VLFFYPKDDTPGCTIECKEFRDARADFQAKAHVFGISPDDMASHQAFRDKYALNFPLLSDPEHRVASLFGVWGPKKNGTEGIHRTTFVIREGKIARVFSDVKPEGHATQVLAAL